MADSDGLPPSVPRVVWWRQLLAIKQTLIIVLTPIVLLIVPLMSPTREGKCAYVILIMAVYWCTEALPMAVTALLPVALMPWLNVLGSKQLCQNYLKDANMLFLGGLLVAVAVEKWGLHTRVALRVLMLVGSKPTWILFGFMAVTGFLSMWLSNTACAAMMIPIACAVLKALNEHRKNLQNARRQEVLQPLLSTPTDDVPSSETNNGHRKSIQVIALERRISVKPSQEETELSIQFEREDSEFRKFSSALKLCIAYASNVGGVGTLIGCGPNIVMKGQADSIYGPNNGIDFTSWFVLAFPLMIINIAISWLTLVLIFIGPRKAFGSCCHRRTAEEEEEENGPNSANAIIRREYAKLGKMTFAEASVMVCFIVLALLWLTKQPGIFRGWLSLLPYHAAGAYVTDSSLAITICVIMFALPSQFPNYLCFRRIKSDDARLTRPPGPAPPLLDWPTVHKQMPWSVIILLGGGFALADACQSSGLSAAIGNFLVGFKSLPPSVVVLIMVVVATVITTFTSNVSTTTIVVPITAELANAIHVNPLYLMIPVTIAASYSYVLPVSTPPNAIVYSYGDITMMDMIKTGLVNCVLHIGVLMVAVNTWGYAYFQFGIYPDWAPSKPSPFNSTELLFNGTDFMNSTMLSG